MILSKFRFYIIDESYGVTGTNDAEVALEFLRNDQTVIDSQQGTWAWDPEESGDLASFEKVDDADLTALNADREEDEDSDDIDDEAEHDEGKVHE